jgi:hypothetical protein
LPILTIGNYCAQVIEYRAVSLVDPIERCGQIDQAAADA